MERRNSEEEKSSLIVEVQDPPIGLWNYCSWWPAHELFPRTKRTVLYSFHKIAHTRWDRTLLGLLSIGTDKIRCWFCHRKRGGNHLLRQFGGVETPTLSTLSLSTSSRPNCVLFKLLLPQNPSWHRHMNSK